MKRKSSWNKTFPVPKAANQCFHSQLIGSGTMVKYFSNVLDGFTRFAKQGIINNQAFRARNIRRISFAFGDF